MINCIYPDMRQVTHDEALTHFKGKTEVWVIVYTSIHEKYQHQLWLHPDVPDDTCIAIWGTFHSAAVAAAMGYPTVVSRRVWGRCPGPPVGISDNTSEQIAASREYSLATTNNDGWGGYGD